MLEEQWGDAGGPAGFSVHRLPTAKRRAPQSTRFGLNETGRDFGTLSRAIGAGHELCKVGCPV